MKRWERTDAESLIREGEIKPGEKKVQAVEQLEFLFSSRGSEGDTAE